MRVAVYGAGSLGTILGSCIRKAGGAIELINRNKAHVEALQTDGAKVVGTVQFCQPVVAYTPDKMSGKYDVIFLMTKQQHNAEVVVMLKEYLAEEGVLVTFQNGLPEMQIAEIIGQERVLGCTVAWGATMQGPGVCELTSAPDALSFSLGGITASRHKYFAAVKALLENMGTVGCTFGEAAGPRRSRRVVQALIKECIDVCKAGGIRIEPVQGKDIVKLLDYSNPLKKAFSSFIIPIAIRKHAKLKASMLQDIEKGKLTEVDAINGAVSAYGRKVGCPTPMNDRVVDIIHRIERGELQPQSENLKYFE